MIRLGEKQTLYIVKETDFGVYLGEKIDETKNTVLLPKKQVPDWVRKGDEIEVFIYKDSEDRLIATTKEPLITLEYFAVLEVKELSSIGAFLDWGLDKDLLLPFKEQIGKIQIGKKYLVALYIDKSQRLCATMKLYDRLFSDHHYHVDSRVKGIVYGRKEGIGAFVAVDNRYHGLIPEKEIFRSLNVGDEIEGRVIRVRQDGKIDISIREKSHIQLGGDSQRIMEHLEKAGGFLPYHDKSDPESVKKKFGMSKAAFKRAIGNLFKNGKIIIEENGIYQK